MPKNRMVAIIATVGALAVAGGIGYFLGAGGKDRRSGPEQGQQAADAGVSYYRCPMHPWITSEKPSTCPICAMDLTPVHEGEGTGIKIDAGTAQTIGVTTEEVTKRTLIRDIRLASTLKADEGREFSVTSRVMGYAERLHVSTMGARVSKGQILLEMYSPDLVSGQAEFVRALVAGDAKQADGARQRLLSWDVAASVIDSIERTRTVIRLVPVLSPASGVIAEKMVVQGQNIMPGMQFYRITDLSRVWAVGEAYQSDLAMIRTGQSAQVIVDFMHGRTFSGTVSFVAPELNGVSRTASVRVELANTGDWALRPGMTGTITIASTVATDAIAVPEQAVIHSGLRDVAVVSLGNGYFEPREVRLGPSAGGYTQVLDGIQEHENVVTSSQFLIDSESNLRAAVKRMVQARPEDSLHQHAGDGHGPVAGDMSAPQTGSAAKHQKLTEQRTCPIMGGPINKKLFVDVKGFRIYMCCAGCTQQIKQDPDKAIAVLAARGEGVEKIR